MQYQSRETKLGRNVKRKYKKYLIKNLVSKMFKLKEHIAQRGAKLCKLLNYKQKEEILKSTRKLKGSNIFINEDFCCETMQHRKKLWEEIKNLRSQGKVAHLNYRSIVVVQNKGNTG